MKTEDLVYTLEVCREYLPVNTHPEHYKRLREIEYLIKLCGDEKRQKTIMYWIQAAIDELSRLEADRRISILIDGGRAILREGGVK
jgi:hypothetical protein